MEGNTTTKCAGCGYIGSAFGCENPACPDAHWHTAVTLEALKMTQDNEAAFRASWNVIDYSKSFGGRK